MFWKKKNPETEIIESTSTEKRESFRYHFKKDRQLQILFKKQPVKVLNISAGGMSFSDTGFQQFDVDSVQFSLDVPNHKGETTFLAKLRILTIDENAICHCIFEQCSLEQHELIHKYVLEMQKDDLAH